MKDMIYNGERAGVEGDFAIDEHGDLVSETENMTAIGLAPGQIVHVGDIATVTAISPSRISLRWSGAWAPVGPVGRVYVARFHRNEPAPLEAYLTAKV
jgi:hypothetical protein